ncbi:MAG: AAA family ATPase [Nitriliruptoraceae bacterium]|nr:AAA family ATPase [Nitriliruptoraceae bacterium]
MEVRHLERVEWAPYPDVDLTAWPFTVPVVRQLIDDGGLDLPAGVTVLLGENGSGKSTLIEAIAAIYPRSGFEASHARMSGPAVVADDERDEAPLRWHLRARTHPLASPAGFFLRAELLHDYLDGVDRDPRQRRAWGERSLLDRSHGETFLEVLRQRFAEPGFYLVDEPEAALSFTGCLGLIALLGELAEVGSQVLVATHSPVVASVPGATIWQLDDEGRHEVAWAETDLVRQWRSFLDEPQRYLRHLSG